jgi:hypothetical protein
MLIHFPIKKKFDINIFLEKPSALKITEKKANN